MNLELKNLNECKKEYTDFVENFSFGTPFHTYEWLSALENNLGNKCKIALFNENSDLIGVCPFFEKNISIIGKIYFSPIFGTETAYLGLLSEQKNLNNLLSLLKKEIKNFFIIQSPDLKILQTNNLEIENADTIITNLDSKDAEEHFKRVRKGHRYDTRKAEKSGIKIIDDYSENSIKEYYSLLLKTYEKSDYKPLPEQFYIDIIKSLHEKAQIKLLFAEYKGKKIAAAAFPIFKDKIYYWTGGSLKEKEVSSLYPNNLIQWELIKWAYSGGLKKYDMLGASIEGIKNFKLGWGGHLESYQRIYSSKKLKLMASVYSKLGAGIKEKIRKGVRE